MTLFQAAAIGLLALIITPGYFFYFDVTPKLVVLLLATAVSLGAAAARVISIVDGMLDTLINHTGH